MNASRITAVVLTQQLECQKQLLEEETNFGKGEALTLTLCSSNKQ